MVEKFSGKLFVVRHAQSDPNNGHLTIAGRKQAERFATELKKGIDVTNAQLLTGPAHRLVETTQIISDELSIGYTILSRLSMASCTRNLPEPSPSYEEDKTLRDILLALTPTPKLAIIVAHSEMMNDLAFLHTNSGLLNRNFENMTGYLIHQNGKMTEIT